MEKLTKAQKELLRDILYNKFHDNGTGKTECLEIIRIAKKSDMKKDFIEELVFDYEAAFDTVLLVF